VLNLKRSGLKGEKSSKNGKTILLAKAKRGCKKEKKRKRPFRKSSTEPFHLNCYPGNVGRGKGSTLRKEKAK